MIREEIYPKVIVYHDAMPNCEEFLRISQTSTKYSTEITEWYTLGNQNMIKNYPHLMFEHFPNADEWKQSFEPMDNPLTDMASNAFYASTSDYVESNSISIPNWVHGTPTINSHFAKSKDEFLAMQYHTDFIMSQTNCRGFKHWVTCNIYLNDDYDGGELSFKIFKNNTEFDFVKYKPRAGDALVFPSHPPYFHGVHKTLKKEKYFIRMFWGYNYEGSPEWLANEQLYGAETWAKMEKQRIDFENKSSMWMKGHLDEY